jgi:hypothetical protein
MHCSDDFLPVESGEFLAASIPDARFVELGGADHAPFVGSGSDHVATEILEFIGGHDSAGPVAGERFGAGLFTYIVDSTAAAARYGDERWASPPTAASRSAAACTQVVTRLPAKTRSA